MVTGQPPKARPEDRGTDGFGVTRAGDVAWPQAVATRLVGSYRRPMTAEEVLRSARTILLIDFPRRDVPDALAAQDSW
jgi:hypothetical protein